MHDLLQRLLSRKFLIAVGAFITFIANKDYNQAMGVVMTYIGINGATEAVSKYKEK